MKNKRFFFQDSLHNNVPYSPHFQIRFSLLSQLLDIYCHANAKSFQPKGVGFRLSESAILHLPNRRIVD